jgi:hypothetical protein
MSVEVIAAAAVGIGVLLTLMAFTVTGERRRGHGVVVALAAGLFFPITWAAWYVRDERPYRTSRRA